MRLAFWQIIMYNIHIEKILCVYSIKIFRRPFMNRKKERKEQLYVRFIF